MTDMPSMRMTGGKFLTKTIVNHTYAFLICFFKNQKTLQAHLLWWLMVSFLTKTIANYASAFVICFFKNQETLQAPLLWWLIDQDKLTCHLWEWLMVSFRLKRLQIIHMLLLFVFLRTKRHCKSICYDDWW